MTLIDAASNGLAPDQIAYRDALQAEIELSQLALRSLRGESSGDFMIKRGALVTELDMAKGALTDSVRERIGDRPPRAKKARLTRENYGEAIASTGTVYNLELPDDTVVPMEFTDAGLSTPTRTVNIKPHGLFVLTTLLSYPALDFTASDFLRAGFAPDGGNDNARRATLSKEAMALDNDLAYLLLGDIHAEDRPVKMGYRGKQRTYRWDYFSQEVPPAITPPETIANNYDIECRDSVWYLGGEAVQLSDLQKSLLKFLYVTPRGINGGIGLDDAVRFLKPLYPNIDSSDLIAAARTFNGTMLKHLPPRSRLALTAIIEDRLSGKGTKLRLNTVLKRPDLTDQEKQEFMADFLAAHKRATQP